MINGIKIEIDASDVGKAKAELDNLSSSVENLEDSTQKSTRTFLEVQKEIATLGTANTAVRVVLVQVISLILF